MDDDVITANLESADYYLKDEVEVFDESVSKSHKDFFIFTNISSLQRAANVLVNFDIQFQTNIVKLTSKEEADFESEKNYYRVVAFGEPDIEGKDTFYPRIYTKE